MDDNLRIFSFDDYVQLNGDYASQIYRGSVQDAGGRQLNIQASCGTRKISIQRDTDDVVDWVTWDIGTGFVFEGATKRLATRRKAQGFPERKQAGKLDHYDPIARALNSDRKAFRCSIAGMAYQLACDLTRTYSLEEEDALSLLFTGKLRVPNLIRSRLSAMPIYDDCGKLLNWAYAPITLTIYPWVDAKNVYSHYLALQRLVFGNRSDGGPKDRQLPTIHNLKFFQFACAYIKNSHKIDWKEITSLWKLNHSEEEWAKNPYPKAARGGEVFRRVFRRLFPLQRGKPYDHEK